MTQLAASKLALWRAKPQVFVREVFGATPDPWQDDVLEAFPHNPRMAFCASKGVGKDQPVSLIVETPDGPRRWGDIKIGDKLFAPDGSETTVIDTINHTGNPQYRVYFDDGSSTLCGLDHHWTVRGAAERARKYEQPFVTLTLREILERGIRNKNGKWQGRQFEIPLHCAVQYRHKYQPLDAYVLGVWLGDGSKNSGRYTGIDKEVAEEILSRGYLLGKEYKDKVRSVLGLQTALKELGLFSLGSHERFIPDIYLRGSIQQRKDLLSGLMDTDGYIGKEGHMEYDTTSLRLAENVIQLVRSLGGNAHLKDSIKKPFYYNKSGEKVYGKDCYRVSLKLTFNPFKIKRKAVRWKQPLSKEQTRYLTRYIDRVEFSHVEDSMCVEVDHPSHCYLTNDFIVTHNSTVLAWLVWNFMVTRPNPKIAVTSISGDNLRDGLWSELALWRDKAPLIKETFEWQKERIFNKHSPENWFVSARQWSKSADPQTIGNTLAGLHSDYIMFLLDESGGMPEAIMATAEAALSSCKEGHIIQAGNPTNLSGPLYNACTRDRSLWYVKEINSDPDDPKRSTRVSEKWAREQIEKYGRDNPWVLVNVFGKFPPSSFNSLISVDSVQEAIKRKYKETEILAHPRVIGVDVARQGADSSILFPRQGLQAFTPTQVRNYDGTQGAELVLRKWDEWEADGVFIDNTGGFGASWIDNLIRLGKDPIGIHFNESSLDRQYFNRRTEMAFKLVNWIKDGGAIPDINELTLALTSITYTFKGDKVILEPKDELKARLGFSPDHMDALMLTFALPVEKKSLFGNNIFRSNHQFEYDPLARNRINN